MIYDMTVTTNDVHIAKHISYLWQAHVAASFFWLTVAVPLYPLDVLRKWAYGQKVIFN